jgi:hypothetical protein
MDMETDNEYNAARCDLQAVVHTKLFEVCYLEGK